MPSDIEGESAPENQKVIIYHSELLHLSQTFIKAQALALKSWIPVFVGEKFVPGGLNLDGLDVRLLFGPRPGRVQRLVNRTLQRMSLPYPPAVSCMRRVGARLVHAHFGPSAVSIWPSVKALGLPMIVTLHGYDINVKREWWEAGFGGWSMRNYPRKLLELAAEPRVHFVAVSEAICRRAIQYGIPENKIELNYIGVDTKRLRPLGLPLESRSRRILFVGRLVEKKGLAYLIQAFAQVRNEVPDAELIIIGDGPLRKELEDLARSLNVVPVFLGPRPHEFVIDEMNRAKVFCAPSVVAQNGDAEGLPVVIMEAAALGVPVVTTSHSGNVEAVLESRTGFCVPEKDPIRLARALKICLVDTDSLGRVTENATKFAGERFSIDKNARELEKIYSENCYQ